MKNVISHYSWTLLYAVIVFFLAFIVSFVIRIYYKRFITRKLRIILLALGTLCLLVAGIGKLGWHSGITTWDGGSTAENLNEIVFWVLSIMGSFCIFLDLSLSLTKNDDMMSKKNNDRELTILKIFGAIYDTHIDDYNKKWQEIKGCKEHKQKHEIIYSPVKLCKVADKIKTTPDIVHQILYYYDDLYTQDDKHFFTYIQNSESWSINFPLLCVKLGESQEKFDYEQSIRNSTRVSAIAAFMAILVSLVTLSVFFLRNSNSSDSPVTPKTNTTLQREANTPDRPGL